MSARPAFAAASERRLLKLTRTLSNAAELGPQWGLKTILVLCMLSILSSAVAHTFTAVTTAKLSNDTATVLQGLHDRLHKAAGILISLLPLMSQIYQAVVLLRWRTVSFLPHPHAVQEHVHTPLLVVLQVVASQSLSNCFCQVTVAVIGLKHAWNDGGNCMQTAGQGTCMTIWSNGIQSVARLSCSNEQHPVTIAQACRRRLSTCHPPSMNPCLDVGIMVLHCGAEDSAPNAATLPVKGMVVAAASR